MVFTSRLPNFTIKIVTITATRDGGILSVSFGKKIKIASAISPTISAVKLVVVMEVIHAITARHDKEQSWSKQHEEMSEKYDKAIADLNKKIDENQIDVEAKIQEVRAEQEILTECMYATLDGLHQLGCNGKVTEARSMLDQYLIRRAHD